jgi:hypothetical protein
MFITWLIVSTVLFHVFTASIASSARSREHDISLWLSATGPIPTGAPLSMGRSPVRDKEDGLSTFGFVEMVIVK